MDEKALNNLRKDLINGNNAPLKKIYMEHKEDCIKVLRQRNFQSAKGFQDIYTDAIMVFRSNVISGKIEKLTSVKNYLLSTCVNMSRQEYNQNVKKKSKEEQVKNLLYPNGEAIMEVNEMKEELIVVCKRALSALSEKCQKILVSYYVHNLSMKEIATEMELSSSDVSKTMKSRCYKKWIAKTKELMS